MNSIFYGTFSTLGFRGALAFGLLLSVLSLPGTANAADKPLTFAVSGVVAKISVRSGTRVSQGTPLASLDLRPFEARKVAADARMAATQIELQQAELHLQQTQELYDSLSASSRDVDQAVLAHANAVASNEQATADAVQADWDLEHAVLRAPRSGVVGAVHGYPGLVINQNTKTPTVIVLR